MPVMVWFNREETEVKRLVPVIVLGILLAGLVLLGLGDTHIAVADTNVYYIETTVGQPEAGNSSASGVITITMTGVLDEWPPTATLFQCQS